MGGRGLFAGQAREHRKIPYEFRNDGYSKQIGETSKGRPFAVLALFLT
jgi:hypothetical protein